MDKELADALPDPGFGNVWNVAYGEWRGTNTPCETVWVHLTTRQAMRYQTHVTEGVDYVVPLLDDEGEALEPSVENIVAAAVKIMDRIAEENINRAEEQRLREEYERVRNEQRAKREAKAKQYVGAYKQKDTGKERGYTSRFA